MENDNLKELPTETPKTKPKAKPKAKAKPKNSPKSESSNESEPKSLSLGKRGLVIVESPSKAKTLKKYLGRNFDVKASVGHVKDLPKSKLGVDLDNDFEPTYELIKGKQKVVDDLIKAAEKADTVYLAADPDREGEAIAWHVAEVLNLPEKKRARVLFNEITKAAVIKAIENPITLNKPRYESQQARRILDRLVGYKISPILWTKVRRGLSAGRVQSVAVRIIVDREREIKAFISEPYWTITAFLDSDKKDFQARLTKVGNQKIDRLTINTEEWAKNIVKDSIEADWKIAAINLKQRKRNPSMPFITSTLQQESSKRLYFSAKKTMVLAQQLYEGIEIGAEGAQGLITYMRTDSIRLSKEAIDEARTFIESTYGKKYLPAQPIEYRNKKNAQDAHEAIRPTSIAFPPDKVKPFLELDQFKLYELIWKRFLACQMEQAIFDQTAIEIEAKGKKDINYFRATGSILRFDGFLTLWQEEEEKSEDNEVQSLPDLNEKSIIHCQKVTDEKHLTQPPPKYSESSLIKELEEKGIGRPSTYANILSTIQDRKYVEKKENRFFPTELGDIVTDLLVENFADIVNVQFTASMEDQLDQIEEGSVSWVKTLKTFYEPFSKALKEAEVKMRNLKKEETLTDLKCPKCEKILIIKWGKNGKFAACQGYPECRFTSEYTQEEGMIKLAVQQTTDEKCEKCTSPMMVKNGRFGKFLACSNYPTCKTTKAITTGIECPECHQGQLSEKRTRFGKSFYSCSKYPTCKYAIWDKPIKGKPCPECKHPFLAEHYTKKEGASIKCPNKECSFKEIAPENNSGESAQS